MGSDLSSNKNISDSMQFRSIKSTPRAASDHSVSMSTLVVAEHASRLDDATQDACAYEEIGMPMPEADDEYIDMLLRKELRHESKAGDFFVDNSFRLIRSDAVRWILKTNASFGFSMKTAYMALAYFDEFFMHRTVGIVEGKIWAVKLLSLACLTLAAKMQEDRVPPLSEFQVGEFRFSSEAIQRMELLVLGALGWRLSTTTPFVYLSYFAPKFCKNGQDLIREAAKFIFAAVDVINLVQYQPSIVAIAAVLAASASDERSTWKTLQSKISGLSSWESLDMENAFCCYNLMVRGLHKERSNPEENVVKQSMNDGGSIKSSVVGNMTNSYVMTSGKRRRLR